MGGHAITIPTYNERDNIGPLVDGILGLGLGFRVIIVDDNSPDGTGQLADELAAEHPAVQVVHRPAKLGLGTAHIAGMKVALEAGADAVLTMDADFSHHPRFIPDILAALERCDVVIGSRYVDGGGTLNCTWPRRALSRGANLFARSMLSLPAGDATAGFRGYRREVLESIAMDDIVSNGYSFLIEMLYRCQQKGWRIGEVPIIFENRQRGASKISRAEILRAMQTVLRLGWERLREQAGGDDIGGREDWSLTRTATRTTRASLTTGRLLVAILFVAIAAMAVRQPADTDTWWHLKSGQVMWETGRVLRADPFSHTVSGQPWIDHGWLVQLILWPIYDALGLQGLSLLVAAAVTLAFVLVYRQCAGRPFVAAFATLLAAVAASVIWSARPQIFSFLLAAVVAFLLDRYKGTVRSRWLWPLPLLVLLWVNMHGGFVIAFILMACYLLGETLNRLTAPGPGSTSIALRPLLLVALFSIPAIFANPNGASMIPYAFQTVSIGPLQDFILEWAAPDFHNLQFHPFIWLLLLTLAAFGLSRRRADWVDLVLIGAFAYMSLLAVRNIALFALVAAPVLSRHAVAALDDLAKTPHLSWLAHLTGGVRPARTRPALTLLNVCLLILVIAGAATKVGLDLMRMDDPEVWGRGLPVDAANWLGQHELSGQMFNTYNWGGYLIWSLHPDKPVFVDGRTDLYTFNSQVLEDYVLVHSLRPGWDGVLDKYGVGYVVTARTGLLDQMLAQTESWELVYGDELAVVRVRKDALR